MLHPVGSNTPNVYWRRRFALLGVVVVVVALVALTVHVLGSGSGSDPGAAGAPGSPTGSPGTSSARSTGSATHSATTRTSRTTSATRSSSARPNTGGGVSGAGQPGAPVACTAKQLAVAAVAAKSNYSIGDQPVVMLQVTNNGSGPCVQDLADSQVVLRIYNGASRVWGSHDCKIEPGVTDRTLTAGQAVRVSIVWSGLSSRPKCAGTRQRVGAGTYTLYASLSGHTGTAAQFTIK